MGIKRLKFHMFPWAFHHLSCLHIQTSEPPPPKTIKLIKSDGLVKIYDRPINVSELMTEFPKHMVCKSDAFYIGQKVPALSENEQLQLGQNYFMLPKSFFQSVVSFFTLASFTSATAKGDSRNAFLKKAGSCQPLDIQKTPSGSLKIRVSDEFISQLMVQGRIKDEDREDEKSKVCTSAELKKDYTQLVGSRRLQWKPKLETIKENEKKKRRFYSFGLKRRKSKSKSISNPKSKTKTNSKSKSKSKSKTNQHIIIRSTDEQKIKPPLKSRKIKFRSKKSSL